LGLNVAGVWNRVEVDRIADDERYLRIEPKAKGAEVD
jgi:hypothetical protein